MEDQIEALYLENQLCFPLYAASRLTTKIYTPLLKALDLTYPQYLVLLVLWQFAEQTVNSIGERLFLESNTLTPLLKRLEQKELIKRSRSVSDERNVLVSLTKKGESLKKEALKIPGKIISSVEDECISRSEVLQFQRTLVKLVAVLSRKSTSNSGFEIS